MAPQVYQDAFNDIHGQQSTALHPKFFNPGVIDDPEIEAEDVRRGQKLDAFELMTLLSSKIIHRLFEVEGEEKLLQEFTTKLGLEDLELKLNEEIGRRCPDCDVSKRRNPNLNVSRVTSLVLAELRESGDLLADQDRRLRAHGAEPTALRELQAGVRQAEGLRGADEPVPELH